MVSLRTVQILLLTLVAAVGRAEEAVAEARAPHKPIVTTDIVTDTIALGHDLYTLISGKMQKYPLPLMAPIQEKIAEQSKILLKDRNVAKIYDSSVEVVTKAKAEALEKGTMLFNKAHGPLEAGAVELLSKLEMLVPELKGAVRHSLGDIAVALLFFGTIFYWLFSIFVWTVRTFFSIFCCICCCGCCRSKGSSKKAKGGAKAGTAAAEKGKAAVANGKAAATAPKGKNKSK